MVCLASVVAPANTHEVCSVKEKTSVHAAEYVVKAVGFVPAAGIFAGLALALEDVVPLQVFCFFDKL